MNSLPCNVGTPGAGLIAVTYRAPPNGAVTLVGKATTLETLTVNSGIGGTVTSDVGGVDCGSTWAQSYPYNTSVTLTATPQPNYRFVGGGADCSGTAATCTVSMTAPHTVSASFQATVQVTLIAQSTSGHAQAAARRAIAPARSPGAASSAASRSRATAPSIPPAARSRSTPARRSR